MANAFSAGTFNPEITGIIGSDAGLLAKNDHGNIWKGIFIFINHFAGNKG